MCSHKVSLLFHPGIKQFPQGLSCLVRCLNWWEILRSHPPEGWQISGKENLAGAELHCQTLFPHLTSEVTCPPSQWWVGARGELEVCGLPSAGMGGLHLHRSALNVLYVLSHLVSRTTYNMVFFILRPRELNNLPKVTQLFRGQHEISAPDFCISKAHA